ncbi:MAG: DNA modification methylase [Spirochaetales bacterium]|nr:DNA modification methylase [Spirochaetales bacterium]
MKCTQKNPPPKSISIKCQGADLKNLDELLEFQGSIKRLSKKNLEKLRNAILKYGFIAPIFIWKSRKKLHILDGHQRLKALRTFEEEGYKIPPLPVDYIHAKSEKEAKEKLLHITSQYGEFDKKGLDEFILTANLDISDLETIRLTDTELKITDPSHTSDTEGDDDVPENIPVITKQGDLWELGRHKVICGDSTDSELVDNLLGNLKADMIFTDPPYGVSYTDKNKFFNKIDKATRIQTPIKNDHLTLKQISSLWADMFTAWKDRLSEYSCYYFCAPQGGDLLLRFMSLMNKNGFPLRHTIIWKKNHHVLGRCDYNYKHEPLLYGWQKKHKFFGYGDQRFSVWEYDKPHKSELHPTMKPVDLIVNAILNSSETNQIIADPFLGSGSTMIACEKTDRICFGMEIDEHYCDVIVKRYIDWCEKNSRKIEIRLNRRKFEISKVKEKASI